MKKALAALNTIVKIVIRLAALAVALIVLTVAGGIFMAGYDEADTILNMDPAELDAHLEQIVGTENKAQAAE